MTKRAICALSMSAIGLLSMQAIAMNNAERAVKKDLPLNSRFLQTQGNAITKDLTQYC